MPFCREVDYPPRTSETAGARHQYLTYVYLAALRSFGVLTGGVGERFLELQGDTFGSRLPDEEHQSPLRKMHGMLSPCVMRKIRARSGVRFRLMLPSCSARETDHERQTAQGLARPGRQGATEPRLATP